MKDRVLPIELTDNDTGKVYKLDFTRKIVDRVEKGGFSVADCEKFPSKIRDLFYYSFLANHEREVTHRKTDEMLDDIGGVLNLPEGLLGRLIELYVQTYDTLVDEKNSRMTVKF